MRRFAFPVVLLILALAPGASAGHVDALYLDYYCVGAEGRAVHADCALDEELWLRGPVAQGLPAASTSVGYDSAGLILPVEPLAPRAAEMEAAGLSPWVILVGAHHLSSAAGDPILLALEPTEGALKRDLFDRLEATGVHFRLVCGWDLSQSRPVCAVYDPEAEPETAVLRAHRDSVLADGGAATAGSASALGRSMAPSISATLAAKRLVLHPTLNVPVEAAAPEAPAPGATTPRSPPATASPPAPSVLSPMVRAGLPDEPERLVPSAPTAATLAPTGEEAPRFAEALARGAVIGASGPIAAVVAAGAVAGLLLVAVGVLAHRHATRANVLANPVRESLYRAVLAHPGATITDLAAAVGVRHSTATHHLDLLAEVGLVVGERVGNRKHWFGNGHVGNRASRLARILPRLGRAEARPADLAAATGISVPGVHWHLARLERLGLVESTPDPEGRRFRLASAARSA